MCIAIYKPKDKILTEATLKECFDSNSDGAGFMYSNGTSLKIHKGYFTFAKFYKAYQAHADKQLLLHFRIKTHGAVAIENCHPFLVSKDLGFIHNGIISHHSGNTGVSDTRDFNEKILKPLVKTYGTTIMARPEIQALIEPYIGYSKLAFLDVDGNFTIMNEDKGVWDDEVWYSNTSYRPYIAPVKQVSMYPSPTYVPLPTTKRDDYYVSKYEKYTKKDATTYYLQRGSKRIEELDMAVVTDSSKGVYKGTHVKVLYISSLAQCDIELPNGTIIPNFAGANLGLVPFQTTFDDSYGENYSGDIATAYGVY